MSEVIALTTLQVVALTATFGAIVALYNKLSDCKTAIGRLEGKMDVLCQERARPHG